MYYTRGGKRNRRRKKTRRTTVTTRGTQFKWECEHCRPFIRLSSAVSLAPPAPVIIVTHLFRRQIRFILTHYHVYLPKSPTNVFILICRLNSILFFHRSVPVLYKMFD